MFYKQLLQEQITKAQRRQSSWLHSGTLKSSNKKINQTFKRSSQTFLLQSFLLLKILNLFFNSRWINNIRITFAGRRIRVVVLDLHLLSSVQKFGRNSKICFRNRARTSRIVQQESQYWKSQRFRRFHFQGTL